MNRCFQSQRECLASCYYANSCGWSSDCGNYGQRSGANGGYNNYRDVGMGGYNNNRGVGMGGYNNNRDVGMGGYNNFRDVGMGGYECASNTSLWWGISLGVLGFCLLVACCVGGFLFYRLKLRHMIAQRRSFSGQEIRAPANYELPPPHFAVNQQLQPATHASGPYYLPGDFKYAPPPLNQDIFIDNYTYSGAVKGEYR